MARKAGNGYQNIRRLEDQAIAKADREMQAKRKASRPVTLTYRPTPARAS